MKLKQAKRIQWNHSNEAIVGENGVKQNGFRVRSAIVSGNSYTCYNGVVDNWTETKQTTDNEGKAGQKRDCRSCTTFNQSSENSMTTQTCGDWYWSS